MSRFLFAAWPIPGSIFPPLSLARALADRGHSVAFYTGERSRALVQGEGHVHFPFGRSLDQMVDSLLLAPDGISKDWNKPWRRVGVFRQFILDPVPQQVADLGPILDEWQPDVIVCEPAMWAPYLIFHEQRRIPVAILEYSFCTLPRRGGPPLGLNLPFASNRAMNLLLRAGAGVYGAALAPLRARLAELRRRHGLSPLDVSVVELMYRMPLVLVPSCPEFDYCRQDLPPTTHYVGACLWYPNQAPSEWLSELPRAKPWVHATEGTLYAQRPKMLRAVAQGLSNRPVEVIITTGSQRSPEMIDLGHTGSNIVVKPWASYPQLLPQTSVMITIGGGGTVMGALAMGVPLVVVPTIWDHPENARRVVDAGVGVQVVPRQITPQRMRTAVETLLDQPSYRRNAQGLAARLKELGGPSRAAELLERLA